MDEKRQKNFLVAAKTKLELSESFGTDDTNSGCEKKGEASWVKGFSESYIKDQTCEKSPYLTCLTESATQVDHNLMERNFSREVSD